MNALPPLNHNNPPDPIDQITAQYDDVRSESENWLDGQRVQTKAQMGAVDLLRKGMRDYRLALERGQKDATAPLYDAYKAEGARWKPTIDDAKQIEAGLVALVDTFKRRLAEEKEAARRKAEAEAWEATRAAREAAQAAEAADLEAQRAAAAAMREAEEAQARAAAAKADTVKGLRTVTRYEITSPRDLLNWLARNRKDDVTAFLEEWARRNHKPDPGAAGLRVWQEKVAF